MSYRIRRAGPEDAAAIVALVVGAYADTYPLRVFYEADRIAAMLAEGRLWSLVAEGDGPIVGHYALKLQPGHHACETGLAIVDPAHRGAGLMDRMREALESEALRLGLRGIYGTPVTAHAASQRVYDKRDNVPTGLMLGAGEVSVTGFHERRVEHLLTYFKYLGKPARPGPLRVPARVQPMVREIFSALGVDVEMLEPTGQELGVEVQELAFEIPVLSFPGPTELRARPERAVYLDLPMDRDGWGALAERAFELGYVFCGVLPMRPHGERLWLQRFTLPLEEQLLTLTHPLSRRIWDFIR